VWDVHVEPAHARRMQVAVKRFANSASAKASFDREVSAAAVAAPLHGGATKSADGRGGERCELTHTGWGGKAQLLAAAHVRSDRVQRLNGRSTDGPARCLVLPLAMAALDDRLFRRGAAPALGYATRLRVARELCAGVAAVHAASFVHGDVKSSNVLLDGQLHATLTVSRSNRSPASQ
jgi:serine/threonine protein kinase